MLLRSGGRLLSICDFQPIGSSRPGFHNICDYNICDESQGLLTIRVRDIHHCIRFIMTHVTVKVYLVIAKGGHFKRSIARLEPDLERRYKCYP